MHYYLDSSGIEFEGDLLEKFGAVSIKEWGTSAFKLSTVKQDRYEGTDCFVLGVPVDVTLNFGNKSYMKRSDTYLDLHFGKIRFGVRFGNGHTKFDTPTLVIGVDSFFKRGNMSMIIEMLGEHVKEILDTGMDYYWETVEAV